ncbi:MAG TPA: hypothetical protein HPP77_00620 [Candidatus Hydrogenedentes bacterium]|nr:hypothetical protein [Candidatus Hydrogenedentota bacterium]HIJ72967.1 hypothetical protein [Candidatus Hydrogenedentota bacterium]
MNDTSPSIEEWKGLFDSAIAFKKAACWDWMLDSDIFGVQDPESGEIGYCSIMGNLGERLALGVYLGPRGLTSLERLFDGALSDNLEEAFDAFVQQECLLASFEDRTELTKSDIAIIRRLGLKFRGRAAWPMFRKLERARFPRPITTQEARFLKIALQQVIRISERKRDDEDLLIPKDKGLAGRLLVTVPRNANEGIAWEDQWLIPERSDETLAVPPPDELKLERLKRGMFPGNGTIEAHFFHSPMAVEDEEDEAASPYYPMALMFVDQRSGMILGMDLTSPWDFSSAFQAGLLQAVERSGLLPASVLVKDERALDLLQPLSKSLGVELRSVTRLKMLEQARRALFREFSQVPPR